MKQKRNLHVEIIREITPLALGVLGFLLVVVMMFTGSRLDNNQFFTLVSQYITGALALSQSPNKDKEAENTSTEIGQNERQH